MNHYEIVYIFNPDEKEQGKSLFNKILETTKSIKGQIHRSEEIGSRRLAYPIKDYYRGEYFLINLECNSSELASITVRVVSEEDYQEWLTGAKIKFAKEIIEEDQFKKLASK